MCSFGDLRPAEVGVVWYMVAKVLDVSVSATSRVLRDNG